MALLNLEHELTRQVDFSKVIELFGEQNTRKVIMKKSNGRTMNLPQ